MYFTAGTTTIVAEQGSQRVFRGGLENGKSRFILRNKEKPWNQRRVGDPLPGNGFPASWPQVGQIFWEAQLFGKPNGRRARSASGDFVLD